MLLLVLSLTIILDTMIKMHLYSGQLEQIPVVVVKSQELEYWLNTLPTGKDSWGQKEQVEEQ